MLQMYLTCAVEVWYVSKLMIIPIQDGTALPWPVSIFTQGNEPRYRDEHPFVLLPFICTVGMV